MPFHNSLVENLSSLFPDRFQSMEWHAWCLATEVQWTGRQLRLSTSQASSARWCSGEKSQSSIVSRRTSKRRKRSTWIRVLLNITNDLEPLVSVLSVWRVKRYDRSRCETNVSVTADASIACHTLSISSCPELSFFRQRYILDLLLKVLFVHCRHHEESLPYRQVKIQARLVLQAQKWGLLRVCMKSWQWSSTRFIRKASEWITIPRPVNWWRKSTILNTWNTMPSNSPFMFLRFTSSSCSAIYERIMEHLRQFYDFKTNKVDRRRATKHCSVILMMGCYRTRLTMTSSSCHSKEPMICTFRPMIRWCVSTQLSNVWNITMNLSIANSKN